MRFQVWARRPFSASAQRWKQKHWVRSHVFGRFRNLSVRYVREDKPTVRSVRTPVVFVITSFNSPSNCL